MKVLLISNHYAELPGGAISVVRATKTLLEDQGHTTVPFSIQEGTTLPTPVRSYFPSVQRLRWQPLPSDATGASPYSFPARESLRRLVADYRPTVAHLHNVFSILTLSVVDALHDEGVPTVMTLHEFKSVCPNGLLFTHDGICHRCVHGGRFWNAVRHRCVGESVYKSAIAAAEAYFYRFRNIWSKVDAFVAPSEFLRDVVVAGGLPADRVEVISNPAPVLEDIGERDIAAPAFFVYSGRLLPQKGLDVLLDASALLRPGIRVVIYGSGPLDQYLRDRVEREGLPVDLRGYADEVTIAADLERCMALVSPSVWYENCPMTILEAAGRGVATVGSDLGALPDLVKHKESGILVAPGDPRSLASALLQLADDPAWAVELGRRAWEDARTRHNPQTHIAAITALYEKAAARSAERDDSLRRHFPHLEPNG